MSGWRRVRLGDVCRVVGGTTPSSSIDEYWNGDVVWVTPTDLGALDGTYIADSARHITKAGYDSCGTEMVPPGTVLLSSRAPIGHLGITAVSLCTNQGCKSFVAGPEIDALFLYFALRNSVDRLRAVGSGATFTEVSKSQLEAFELELPRLADQCRIAARLTKQLAAVERARAAALDSVESASRIEAGLLTAVANQISGAGWPVYRLDEIALGPDAFADGPFGSNLKTDHYAAQGARVIRLQNIGRGRFLGDDRAFISMEHYQTLQRHDAWPGDVVVAALGSGARPAGRACELPEGLGPALVKADCFRVRLPRARMLPAYLVLLLNVPDQLSGVAEAMRGATRPRVTLEMVRRWRLPLPPVEVQARLTAQFLEGQAGADRALQAAKMKLGAIDALPAALLREAFSSAG